MITAQVICELIDAGLSGDSLKAACRRIEEASRGPTYGKPWSPRNDFYGPLVPRLSNVDWWRLSATVRARDGDICTYCKSEDGPWCVDHIVPLSRGGSNGAHNLTTCCIPCNSSKSDKLLTEWEGRHVYQTAN